MITLFGRPITLRPGNIMIKGLSKLPQQPSLFDLPKMPTLEQANTDVQEGKTIQKDGHTYEYRRSKKNPLVRRLFRQDDLFGGEEETKPEIKKPVVQEKPKQSAPEDSAQYDLFGSAPEEPKKKPVIPLRNKKPEEQPKKEETKVDTPKVEKPKIEAPKEPVEDIFGKNDLPQLESETPKEEPKPISELKKDAQSKEPEIKPSSAEQALEQFGNTESEDSFGIAGTAASGKIKKRVEINKQAVDIITNVDPIDITDEQKNILKMYSGRGGIKSATNLDDISLNEFYTRPVEANAIWNILGKLGFSGGEGLEPSCGTGVFLQTAPEKTLMTGVELEETSGKIADILHGSNHYVKINSFEQHCAKSEGGMYDVVAGNVPFGDRGATKYDDTQYREYGRHEQYFLMRSLDELSEGGLMALIVHPGVMDNNWQQFRAALNAKGEFIGAIRLPTGAFKHANATTSSDIIFMRKRPEAVIEHIQNASPEQKAELYSKGILNSDFISGTYYDNKPDAKLGETGKGRFGAEIQLGECTQEMIEDAAYTLNYEKQDYSDLGIDFTPVEERKLQEGDTIQKNGRTYRLNKNHRWERVSEEEMNELPPSPAMLSAGFKTRAEAEKAMNDPAMMVNIDKKHLFLLATETGNSDLAHILRRVSHSNPHKDEALTKAAVIGNYILSQQKKIQAGQGDSIMAQKLIKMCQDFKDTYGHPVKDLHLDNVARLPEAVKNFLSSFDEEGNIIEHFLDPEKFDAAAKNNTDLIAEHRYNPQNGYSIMEYLLNTGQPTGINTIQALYEGEGNVLHELLSNEEVALDENGDFNKASEVYSGLTNGKIDSWEAKKEELEAEIGGNPNAARLFDKYNQQIIKIKELARYQQLNDLPVMMNDAGRFFDVSILNDYLEQTMGEDYLGAIEKNEYGMFNFSDPVLAEIYSLYIQKGRGIDKEDKKKLDGLLKRFFSLGKSYDHDPFCMLMLNKLNGYSVRRAGSGGMARLDGIEKGFKDYLKGHEDSLDIEERYNRGYNNYIHKNYESTPFHIDGLKEEMKTKVGGHQWQLVRRMLDQGKGLVAHGVGLGKTLEAILLVKSLKTQGKAKKPLVVVPGSVLKNWVNEFNKWIDNPNILVVGMYQDKDGNWKDESAVEMQAKLKKAALGTYDAVIMTRDTFSRVEMSPDAIREPIQDLVSRIAVVNPNDKNIKNAKKKHEAALEKIAGALNNVNPISGVYLDKLGFDAIIRDEAHDCKNLLVPIVEDVKGADGATSSRAIHNYLFSRIVSGKKNGNGIYMLTATPISNSPTEVFNMMLPFAADDMRELGLDTMDSFILKFCNRDMKMTMDSAGGVYEEERFSGWSAPQAIQNLFYRYTDYKTKDDVAGINIHIPKEKPNHVLTNLNEGQKALMYKCKLRLLAMRYTDEQDNGEMYFDSNRAGYELKEGIITQKEYQEAKDYFEKVYKPKTRELYFAKLAAGEIEQNQKVRDHYFKVQADMVKIASDLAWYQEKGSDFSHTIDSDYVQQHESIDKITEMVNSAKAIHESGGKQIIFAQNVVLHPKIKEELIKAGIKENEIAIVNAKTVGNSEKRSKVSEEFNSGKYKVVIGNYDTMGEGLNFQIGSTDVHHLQPAWNHRAIEQGNGRAMRQGNSLETVNAHYYLSKGSIDGMMQDKIMQKKDMVDKFLRGESADWDDFAELDPEEMLVALSDNPEQAQALKNARAKRIEEYYNAKESSLALQKMKKFYGLKQKLMKLPDDSPVKENLIKEYNELSTDLAASSHFKHKELLGLDQHPVIVPQSDLVIPVGSTIKRETPDGKQFSYTVEKYNPYTNKVTLYRLPEAEPFKNDNPTVEIDASKLGSVSISNHAAEYYKNLLQSKGRWLNMQTLARIPADFIRQHHKEILEYIQEHQRHNTFVVYDKNGVIKDVDGYSLPAHFQDGYKLLTQAAPNYESLVYNGIQKYKEVPFRLREQLESIFGRNYKANLKAALKEKGIDVPDDKTTDISANENAGILSIPKLKLSKLVSQMEQEKVLDSREATKIINSANKGETHWTGFNQLQSYVTSKFIDEFSDMPIRYETGGLYGVRKPTISRKEMPENFQEKLQQYKDEYGITPYITIKD